jgi:hypothetical protein
MHGPACGTSYTFDVDASSPYSASSRRCTSPSTT